MNEPRPKLFIAEDSDIGELYEISYQKDYDVVVARDGRQAWKLVDEHVSFDVCLIDIVMPVESASFPAAQAMNTGLRLLEKILNEGKCSRVLVVTVRQEVESTVQQMCKGRAACIVLHKKQGPQPINESLSRLLRDEVPQ